MTEQTPTTYCANHPTRETVLRCNRCDKLICTECAVLTPTGYRCRECVREQQKVFDSAVWYDYLLGFGIAFFLSLVASLIFAGIGMFTGFFGFILAVFGGPFAGVAIGESVRFIIKRRRARSLFMTIFVAIILGASTCGYLFPLLLPYFPRISLPVDRAGHLSFYRRAHRLLPRFRFQAR